MQIDLYSSDQARTVLADLWPKIKSALDAGRRLRLSIEPAKRSHEQNEKFHAIISEIAAQAQHLGARWDCETWKRLLLREWAREVGKPAGRMIPTLDGQSVIELGVQSRRFSVEDATSFVDWLHAWAAQNGVELSQ